MYAIIKAGGKQLKVAKGDKVNVERVSAEKGEKVALDQVLMIADGDKVTVGTPTVDGAVVNATVVEQIRDKKIIVFKKKRRHNYRRKKGHRQYLTVLQIDEIKASGGSKTAKPKADAKSETKSEAKGEKAAGDAKQKKTANE